MPMLPPGAVPLTPEELQSLTPLDPALPAGAQRVDPFTEFDEATLLEKLRSSELSHAELKRYAAENLPPSHNADEQQFATRLKLARVSEAYKDTDFTPADFAKMAAGTFSALWETGKALGQTVPKVAAVTPGALAAKAIGRTAADALPLPESVKQQMGVGKPVIEEALQSGGEIFAGVESEGTMLLQMAERAASKVMRSRAAQGIMSLLPVGGSVAATAGRTAGLAPSFAKMTNGQILAEFDEDIEAEQDLAQTMQGGGALTQALYGPDTATGSLLANAGMELRPEEIETVMKAGLVGLPAFAGAGAAAKGALGAAGRAAYKAVPFVAAESAAAKAGQLALDAAKKALANPASAELAEAAKVAAQVHKSALEVAANAAGKAPVIAARAGVEKLAQAGSVAGEKLAEGLTKGAGWAARGAVRGAQAVLGTTEWLGKMGPLIGFGAGAVKAGPWGAMAGGLAGERIAQSIGRILEPMRKVTARLDQSGRNLVAGTPAKAGPYGRLAFDVANATPQFLAQVGLGALDDVFFAMATSETPEELQNQPMFGTFLRAVPAAGRVAGRVTGGQESHPRNWWKNASTSNKTEYGVFPGLDAMHTDLVGKADAGVSARIGAIRAMTESRGGQVFLADPARAQAFLEQHGYTPEEAAHAVKQRGMSLFNVPDATGKPHRIAFAFTPDAAPHEAKHLFQAAQGEVANRLVNKIIKADYGNRWDEIGQDYVSRLLPEAARKEAAALGLTWQEAWVRHADNIGPKESITEAYANERADDLLGSEIAADIYDGLVEHGGPELLVSQGLPGKLARILSGVLQAFGQEPWEGAPVLKEAFDPAGIQIPLKARSAEAVRKAALGTPEAPVAAPDLLTPPSATAPRVEPAAPTPPPLPTAPRVDPTTLSGAELTQARADAHQRAQDAAKELLTPLPKDLTGDARVAKQNEIQQRFEQAKKDGEDLWREQLSRQAKATPTPAPAPAPKAPVVKPAATPGKAEQLPLDFTAPAPKVEPAAPVAPKAAPTPAAPKVEPATPTPSARLDSPEAVEKVIRDNPDTRTFQIEHAQVERATDATREQERLAQEVGRELPDDVRQKVEKIFTVRNGSDGQPRFEDTGKGKMVVGIAPIQRLVNAKRVVQMAHAANRNDLIPYPTNGKGSLTSDAWRSLHADMERVQWNHEHGWRGDGTGPIKVPEGIDAFVPPDTMPKDGQLEVPQMKADFINLLNGASIAPPKSLRAAPKGQKQHANVRAAGIAKASQRGNEPARTGALPGESGGYFGDDLMAAIKGESQPRQETNPLRKRMAEEGLPIYTVPDVESRIHLKHITRAEPRTDIRNDAVSSDVTRAGFSPARDLGFSAKEEAAIDRASRYFEIGHGPALDREGTDAGTYSKDRMWLYNPEQRQLLTGDTDGTHEGRWSGTDRAYKGRYDDAQKKVSVMFPDRERERIEAEGREPSVDDIPAGVYNSLQRQFGKKAKIIAFSPGRKTKSAGDLLVKEIKRDEPDYWETEISEWLPLGRDGESIRLELVTSGIGDHPVAKSAYTKETGSTDTSVQWDKEYAGWARKRAAEVIYGEEKVKAAIAKDPTFFQAEPSEASLKALGQSTTSGFVYKPAPEAGYTPPDLPTTRASDVDQSAWLMPDGKAYLVKNSAAGGYHDAHVYGFADFDTTPVAGKQGDAVVAEFQRQTGGVRLAVLSSNRRLYDGGGDLGISTSYKPTEAQLSFLKSRMLAELNPGTPSFRTIAVDVTGPDGNVVMGKVFSGPNHKMLVGEVMRYLRDPLKAAAEQPKFSPARADDNRVVLGMANRDGTEFAGMRISNRTPQGRFPQHRELFPQNNDVDYKFRYLPGEDTVYWWERPSREVMDDVAARLEDRGLGSRVATR
jgi:hypothetical protein